MRLDLFSQEDSVLLLGEGNFSFTKSLVSHNLPIKITATCFDKGVKYKSQLENIEFLKNKEIPVYMDVDATKLHEHPVLSCHRYSKIIFNFPHVGGKMKIQLNRQLVRKFCESSSHLLCNNGQLIISLCNGQGGTPADDPQRNWNDSWQVTEMAAYGNFYLTSVEPFDFNNFQSYRCTGYRSQDCNFNLNGALVHVFKKKVTPCRLISDELIIKRLSLVPLHGVPDLSVPFYYSDLYSKSPISNNNSSVCFFKDLVLKHLENCLGRNTLKILNSKNIPVAVDSINGVICQFNGEYQKLCSSAFQVIHNLVEEFNSCYTEEKVVFYPGMFFNSSLGQDFDRTPPISFQFVLLGKNVSVHFKNIFGDLLSLFKTSDIELCHDRIFSNVMNRDEVELPHSEVIMGCMNEKIVPISKLEEWHYTDSKGIRNILGHELYLKDVELETFIIYVDKLIELFFCTSSWKEFWSENSFVSLDSDKKPVLKQDVLYPSCYTFDVTLKYETEKGLLEDDVYETLRLSAVDMIKKVEMINEYNSGMGWLSKCFRITYQSLNEALNRSKALDVHVQLVHKMLISALPVTIK